MGILEKIKSGPNRCNSLNGSMWLKCGCKAFFFWGGGGGGAIIVDVFKQPR